MTDHHLATTGTRPSAVQPGTGYRSMSYLDEPTAKELDWASIWAKIQPVSPYGRRRKQSATPYLPGQEPAWKADLEQLRIDLKTWDPQTVDDLRQRLEGLPDAGDVLQHLIQNGAPLGHKELLALKGVAYTGCQLSTMESLRGWSTPGTWHECLEMFGAADTRSFSVEHIAGDAYRGELKTLAAAQGALARSTRERDLEIAEEFGARPNRDGVLSVSLPTEREAANVLKTRSAVTWLRDTPFESVFEVLPTPAMQQALADLDANRERLEALELEALVRITETLRGTVEALQQLLRDLGELDWRLAKVVVARHWQGAVPEPGESVRLTDAVHPLVAERLAKGGGAFVPLSFRPANGANVLCGSNMGGKTVAMTLVCICQALAQYGLPVPAGGFATRLVEIIRFASAANTDAQSGLSSFGSEMVRLTEVWEDACQAGAALVCLDEPGRSTNPTEGEALVIGILKSFVHSSSSESVTLIATHFAAPLNEPGAAKFRVKGIRTDSLAHLGGKQSVEPHARLKGLEADMDYRIEPVHDTEIPEEGLRIAAWLGVPADILRESQAYLRRGKSL